ncbi:MAG: glycosyltransferase family 2 protein [Isosphaeraceae bacterium]
MTDIDLILLSRDLSPLRPDVLEAIRAQQGVRPRVIRVTGPPAPGDRSRFETIVRARNAARDRGTTPFVMLLDDDVVLGPRCLLALAEGLRTRPQFVALGADSAGEMADGLGHWDYPRHVGMAAVLFRREHLRQLAFRWQPDRCECRCCCDDLRRAGHAIGYQRGAIAWHRPRRMADPAGVAVDRKLPGRILAAFDRTHLRLFIKRFLRSLRAEGNPEVVTAVTSGLYPSERRRLAGLPGVEVVVAPNDGHPARQRLRDFQPVIARWPAETPVAYWDAADVVFQARIAPLWDLVRRDPDRLLAATEAIPFRESITFKYWTYTIQDPQARARAEELFRDHDTINSGFGAGTARAMLRYLKAANRLLNSPALAGTGDWGDQTAMNLYCRSHPDRWREVPRGWNYCLVGLGPAHYRVGEDGRTSRLDGQPLHVVHGAGKTLKPWDLVHLTA